MQALDDDEMMRQYANLLLRQDTAREEALKALQARTALQAEVAGGKSKCLRFVPSEHHHHTLHRCVLILATLGRS